MQKQQQQQQQQQQGDKLLVKHATTTTATATATTTTTTTTTTKTETVATGTGRVTAVKTFAQTERREREREQSGAAQAKTKKITASSATTGAAVVDSILSVNMTGQLDDEEQPQQPEQPHPQARAEEPMATSIDMSDMDLQELQDIVHLLWGKNIRADVFQRWSQGFIFSESEPSALVQKQGGPCAVIAPVQAYLLKFIIMDMPGQQLKDLTPDKCQSLLIQALCNILTNCRTPNFRMVTLRAASEDDDDDDLRHSGGSVASDDVKYDDVAGVALSPKPAAKAAVDDAEQLVPLDASTSSAAAIAAIACASPSSATVNVPANASLTQEEFHARLQTVHYDTIEAVEHFYADHLQELSNDYAVLLFLYSVFLTKGCADVNADLTDTSEPLIHNTFGYGAQAVINLMLTGRAVAHVWDNDQDVGGLKLRGISEQSDIGFITLMEQLRYCTVGSFYKNPRYPVWVMGSDTHLTVLFSSEKRLVSPETPSEHGRRVFKSYDPEGNNFISTSVLQDVLAALNLVSEPAYVNIMQKRLDPENLGIILLNAFMDEFFPIEKRSTPDTFELMHYNGIPGSNMNNKVRYYCGGAVLLEGDIKNVYTTNPMVTCLQSKWPNIEVSWQDAHTPSLN